MESISHRGRVVAIAGERIDVEMIVESACASCRARKSCGMDERTEKIVSVYEPHPETYAVGDEVIVSISQVMGIKAVLFAYVYPFFLLLATLLILTHLGCSETVSGLSALGTLAIYYPLLYLLRGRLEKEIIFELKKS